MANVEFQSNDWGKMSGTATCVAGPLTPGDTVTVNGNYDLSSLIHGSGKGSAFDGAVVQQIELDDMRGEPISIYSWRIRCYMGAPNVGHTHMHFTDQSPDTYALSAWMDGVQMHEVSYNSSAPNIASFTWNIDGTAMAPETASDAGY